MSREKETGFGVLVCTHSPRRKKTSIKVRVLFFCPLSARWKYAGCRSVALLCMPLTPWLKILGPKWARARLVNQRDLSNSIAVSCVCQVACVCNECRLLLLRCCWAGCILMSWSLICSDSLVCNMYILILCIETMQINKKFLRSKNCILEIFQKIPYNFNYATWYFINIFWLLKSCISIKKMQFVIISSLF